MDGLRKQFLAEVSEPQLTATVEVLETVERKLLHMEAGGSPDE